MHQISDAAAAMNTKKLSSKQVISRQAGRLYLVAIHQLVRPVYYNHLTYLVAQFNDLKKRPGELRL